MMAMDHDEVQESLGAYALGAMPEGEVAQMRAHILTCEACMRDADALTEAASSFGVSAGSVPLPAGFSERVLTQVRHERPSTPTTPSRSRPRWTSVLAGAASAALIAFAVFSVLSMRSDLDRAETVLAAVLHGEGLDLRGPSGAVGKVTTSESGTLFAATGLQPAPSEHDYQLWLLRDGEPVSAGTFDIHDGIGLVETELSLEDFEGAAVTIERDGGVSQPTGDAVLTSG